LQHSRSSLIVKQTIAVIYFKPSILLSDLAMKPALDVLYKLITTYLILFCSYCVVFTVSIFADKFSGKRKEEKKKTRGEASSFLRSRYRLDHSRTTSRPFAKNQFQEGGKSKISRDISCSCSCANIKLRVVHFIRIGYENWSISLQPASAVWSELTSLRRNWNCIFNSRKQRWRAK